MQTIVVTDLKKKIDDNEKVFILDVRPRQAFDAWKIKTKSNLNLVNVPPPELESFLDSIPKDKTIYTLCARGNSSKMATS